MSGQMGSYCDNITNSILSAFKMGVQHGNTEKYEDTTQIENLAQKLCQVEALFSNELNAINNSKFTDLDSFDRETRKVIQQCQKTVIKEASTSRRYQDIVSGCAALYHAASENANNDAAGTDAMQQTVIDDDIQMETNEQFIDPITKRPIQNPYRNKFCKHIYEYSSIEASLKGGTYMRCPYVGCPNREPLKMTDLVEDRAVRLKIMQNEQNNAMNESLDLF